MQISWRRLGFGRNVFVSFSVWLQLGWLRKKQISRPILVDDGPEGAVIIADNFYTFFIKEKYIKVIYKGVF